MAQCRRRSRLLRGPRQHGGRVLVAAPVVAPSASGDLAGAAAVVPGVLRVRAQRQEAGQGVSGVVGRTSGSTPESRMSLRGFLTSRPFQPFRITLTDGRTYDVSHPELALFGR